MDKSSKRIINYLKKRPDYMIFYSDIDCEELNLSEDEFFRCVRYLASIDMIDYLSNQDGVHLGVQLTHEAVHMNEFKRASRISSFKKWFFVSYVGGVITGVTVTLLGQALVPLCSELFERLYLLICNR